MGSPKRKLDPAKDITCRAKFLQRLLETEGDVAAAANSVGLVPIIAYKARKLDPDFEADWAEVKEIIKEHKADQIERTLIRGATEGHTHTAALPGIGAVEVQDAPDTRAGEFLLKGYRPVTFRERPPQTFLNEFQTLAELFRAVETAKREVAPPEPLPALGPLIEVKAEE